MTVRASNSSIQSLGNRRGIGRVLIVIAIAFLAARIVNCQTSNQHHLSVQISLEKTVADTALLIGISPELKKLREMQARRISEGASITLEELSLRQEVQVSIEASVLNVDSVLAELANEQAELDMVRTILRARRDRKVSHLTTAALLTGSGLATAASATQFTTFSNTTQDTGDAIAIGSGAASMILSILASRAQGGSKQSVGNTPNMLAPLFDRDPMLNTFYPPEVLRFLRSVPVTENPDSGTRLDQLIADWEKTGRLSATDFLKRRQQILAVTASGDASQKVSIDDLSDRISMLVDVQGRVSLMKRDMATLMRYAFVKSGYEFEGR